MHQKYIIWWVSRYRNDAALVQILASKDDLGPSDFHFCDIPQSALEIWLKVWKTAIFATRDISTTDVNVEGGQFLFSHAELWGGGWITTFGLGKFWIFEAK